MIARHPSLPWVLIYFELWGVVVPGLWYESAWFIPRPERVW